MELGGTGLAHSHTPRQQLRSLLDSVIVAGRTDVHDYSGGHLNEANLYKPPKQANHKIWKSAKKQSTQRSYRPGLSRDNCYQENMKETLVNFSLGTFGNVIVPPVSHKSSPSPVKLKKQKASFVQADSGASQHGTARKSPAESQGSYDKCDDGILVEELKLPEVMLHRTQAPQIGCVSRRSLIDVPMHHEFLAGHLNAVTKKDQFDKLKKFETEILCKQDAFERNVMQGTKAIEHLESKLKMGLVGLDYDGCGPNFYRLQVYSSIFEELNDASPTLGFMLKTIKREYDAYVASLLDSPTGQHRVLYEQVSLLASHPSANPACLALEQARVNDLEEEAREMLEENERLRQAVCEEMERPIEPEPEPVRKTQPKLENVATKDLVEIVEDLRANILEKFDAVQSLRALLRKEYVPSTVCTHLEQCIKETEVEIQRLMSNKNYFETNVTEMENDLQEAIENADTTERDQSEILEIINTPGEERRVWKRISAVKFGGSDGGDVDSEAEQDDASKWEWYIS